MSASRAPQASSRTSDGEPSRVSVIDCIDSSAIATATAIRSAVPNDRRARQTSSAWIA